MNEDVGEQEYSQQSMPVLGRQDAEFLKYLLDTGDMVAELQMELEGKEILTDQDTGQAYIKQTRPPLVNPSMRNKIVNILKTYNTRGFITTNLANPEIHRMVCEASNQVIDLIETSKRYSSVEWESDINYKTQYPSFMVGTQQQILLMIEHTILGTLKRSSNALTLNKVTGMHTSSEVKTQAGQQRRSVLDQLKVFK